MTIFSALYCYEKKVWERERHENYHLLIAISLICQQDDEDLEQNLRLRLHAARFMQAVGVVIDNLQTPNDKLSALLSDIGEQHSHLHSFHHEYFRAFREAFLTTLEHSLGKDRFKGELRAAWDSVIGFMTREMNHGHKEIRI